MGAVALVTSDEQLTYAEMLDQADALVEGIPARSLVFVIATNTIPAVLGYVGCLRKHAVVVMLKDGIPEGQLAGLLDAYKPQFIWAPESFAGFLSENGSVEVENRGYQLFATGSEPIECNDDLALLLTTSGSTGTPKFVRLSYGNIRSNAESIAEYQGLTPSDRAITTLPLSYSYGLSILNSHLVAGASIALTDASLMERDFWTFLSEVEATDFGGVPYTYAMLKRLRFSRMELPSLRFISQAGGRLSESLQELFASDCERMGIEFFVMYGQTEATARIAWLPPKDASTKIGSIGRAIPGGTLELKAADGGLITEADVAGEMVYRGPNVSLGYATCRADLALGDENCGVLSTGDMAKRDQDGYFYIVGRLKRFLKMFGNRVSLDEVEALLSRHGVEAACSGTDDNMAVFTTATDTDAVLEILVNETKLNRRGFKVTHLDDLPRLDTGKIDYTSLEKLC